MLNPESSDGRGRELLVSLLEKSTKTFLQYDLQKNLCQNTLKIYRNIYRKNLSAMIYRLPISF